MYARPTLVPCVGDVVLVPARVLYLVDGSGERMVTLRCIGSEVVGGRRGWSQFSMPLASLAAVIGPAENHEWVPFRSW